MNSIACKEAGAYYTPDATAASLVRWVLRRDIDRLLDPSCGDGRFLAMHRRSVGVEQNSAAIARASERAPNALIHKCDFFTWARETNERFECAAGNPPFIRYQLFSGIVRKKALELCRELGVEFSALSSSWAPFLVVTASLLKPSGRMAFVVPAEIGHAPYAAPLVRFLTRRFSEVHIVAVREKIFPELSEDCWLLFASGYGESTECIRFTAIDRFDSAKLRPSHCTRISVAEWITWNQRLRPFLIQSDLRAYYQSTVQKPHSSRLYDVAKVGIGYVTGANDFFHLKPSTAQTHRIPDELLHVSVRSSKMLTSPAVTSEMIRTWLLRDDPVLLLRIRRGETVPPEVRHYLETPEALKASQSYKCRNRRPWYAVPDVRIPHAFLSYMSNRSPLLVANRARCTCSNSIHAVTLFGKMSVKQLQEQWGDPFTQLSCEIEGHPLGGGVLKLEPREALRIVITPRNARTAKERQLIDDGIETMRKWRHCG